MPEQFNKYERGAPEVANERSLGALTNSSFAMSISECSSEDSKWKSSEALDNENVTNIVKKMKYY